MVHVGGLGEEDLGDFGVTPDDGGEQRGRAVYVEKRDTGIRKRQPGSRLAGIGLAEWRGKPVAGECGHDFEGARMRGPA